MEPQQPVFTVEPPGAPPPRRPASGFLRGLQGYRGTFLSMLLMIAVFAWYIGNWEVAAGAVILIFVHEMGHVVAAKALGMPVTAPLFIPFIGAAIVMRENPRDAISEAIMAYAGPLAGCVGSWACLLLAQQTNLWWLMEVAAISFGLNLFNLIPVPPLDGGRVCAAVSRWFWLPGLLLIAGTMIVLLRATSIAHSWQMLLIGSLVLMSAFRRIRDDMRYHEQMRQYYRTSLPMRALVAAFYLGLIGVLLIGLAEANSAL
jgi:Zn-dependent protease